MQSPLAGAFYFKKLEARVGIEPTHKGFADLSLTTWVPRLETYILLKQGAGETGSGRKCIATLEGIFGAGDRGRTGDIFLGKEALYH